MMNFISKKEIIQEEKIAVVKKYFMCSNCFFLKK